MLLSLGGLSFVMREDEVEKNLTVLFFVAFLVMLMSQCTGLVSRRWTQELKGRREEMVSWCFGMNI